MRMPPAQPRHGRHRRAALAAGLLFLGLAACVPPPTPPSHGQFSEAGGLPLQAPREYRLAPGDEIEIAFARTPEFNSRQLLRADGAISLPGLRPPSPVELVASDLTLRELRRQLVAIYGRELRAPEITITLRAYGAAVVYVTGEVGRPGAVPFAGALTVLQAISAAEGPKSSAKLSQILVIRPSLQGGARWRIVDLQKAYRSGDFREDAALSPRDIVYVPRSHIGNVDEFVDLYIRRTLPISPGLTLPVQ